ncbi:hypothetical protein MUP77_03690 [Candidatus Bathyarchaeota archaeon]|nr:hypothetical protein [Candidatus Bathyarchaeota archaeon]
MKIEIFDDDLRKFPDLMVLMREARGIKVSEIDSRLEEFKEDVYTEIRRGFTLEGLKDEPIFRAYRDFFWRMGVDPTKVRPAAEALIRRILGGRSMPRINTVVDAYNLASMTTHIALAAFDTSRLNGDIVIRFADKGEEFLGIGMDKPDILNGGEVGMSDSWRLLAIYPHRDAEYSKITLQTDELIIISCGVPGIQADLLREAAEKAYSFIIMFCSEL